MAVVVVICAGIIVGVGVGVEGEGIQKSSCHFGNVIGLIVDGSSRSSSSSVAIVVVE